LKHGGNVNAIFYGFTGSRTVGNVPDDVDSIPLPSLRSKTNSENEYSMWHTFNPSLHHYTLLPLKMIRSLTKPALAEKETKNGRCF
jgi:hypothetical protein